MEEIKLWRWRFTNEFEKRVESSWHMSDTVRQFAQVYTDAVSGEDSLEIRETAKLSAP